MKFIVKNHSYGCSGPLINTRLFFFAQFVMRIPKPIDAWAT
jgi:hypothetical protein